jgi:hypothetical protein
MNKVVRLAKDKRANTHWFARQMTQPFWPLPKADWLRTFLVPYADPATS